MTKDEAKDYIEGIAERLEWLGKTVRLSARSIEATGDAMSAFYSPRDGAFAVLAGDMVDAWRAIHQPGSNLADLKPDDAPATILIYPWPDGYDHET